MLLNSERIASFSKGLIHSRTIYLMSVMEELRNRIRCHWRLIPTIDAQPRIILSFCNHALSIWNPALARQYTRTPLPPCAPALFIMYDTSR